MVEKKRTRAAPVLKKADTDTHLQELRKRAEEMLRAGHPQSGLPFKVKELVEELRIHQVELEMQNDELRESQLRLQEATQKYYDLYEFAPVGYLTLDRAGSILEPNMALAHMLGIPQKYLAGRMLRQFTVQEDQTRLATHLRRTFSSNSLQKTEIRLTHKDGRTIYTAVQSIADETRSLSRTAISDVTELRLEEQKLRIAFERLRTLTSELSRNEEVTLRHIGSELHDRIGQNLAAIKIKVDLLRSVRKGSKKELDEISGLLNDTIRNTRSLSFEVSPAVLYELGFGSSIEWLAERLSEEHGKEIIVDAKDMPEIDKEMEIFIFRMVRELLINSIKHSGTNEMKVILFREGTNLAIDVVDRGTGFDAEEIEANATGFGLFSIRERVRSFGGSMTIESQPGQGTRVGLLIPAIL